MDTLEQAYPARLTDQLQRISLLLQGDTHAGFYKHAVFNLIFLKYAADTFDARCRQLQPQWMDENRDGWPDNPALFHQADVLWVPKPAHWRVWCGQLASASRQSETPWQCTSVAEIMDQALRDIEQSNVRWQGVLQPVSRYPLRADRLLALIEVFSATEFVQSDLPDVGPELHHRRILRYVYGFCLSLFTVSRPLSIENSFITTMRNTDRKSCFAGREW